MKKINKKQKIIFIFTIALIVIAIISIITNSIIKYNNKISDENYFSVLANANSKLVANYIKEGITIGGITGTLEVLDTSDATATEQDISWGKTGYVNGIKITGTRIDTVAQAKEAQKNFDKNTILLDDYGNNVTVPAGFKIAEDSATSVTGGVVIEDVSADGSTQYTKGSQFVWIPIGDVKTDSNGTITPITLGRYTFASNGTATLVQSADDYKKETQLKSVSTDSYYFQELLKEKSTKNTKAKDLESFILKSTSRGGYYIGRYEAGDAYATTTARTSSSSDSNPVVCKKDFYPYNFTTQSTIASLCQGMYNSNYFESDLSNSYAWDTAIVFIQTFSGDKDYSRQIRLQNTIAKCSEATDGKNKDIRCNIYDMAGNTSEYITEWCSTSNNPCVIRGGCFANDASYPSVRAYGLITSQLDYRSGRPILYL